MKDNRRYTMVFRQTEKGNYISKGKEGMTYVMDHDGGWYRGILPKRQKTLDMPSDDSHKVSYPS